MAEENYKCYCTKCKKMMDSKRFYTLRNGEKTEMCKNCLTMHVDAFNPDTFKWILEKMDKPYIPQKWNEVRDKEYLKDPYNVKGGVVFGKYLTVMRLNQWRDKGWADSEMLQIEETKRQELEQEDRRRFEEDIRQRFDAGEIDESQYRTLTTVDYQHEHDPKFPPIIPTTDVYMSEEQLDNYTEELTEEDRIYLAMKWGRLYKPNEWVELEKKYNEMTKDFEINDSDSIGTLILICKTFLKMNQAIDINDLDGYQKLSRTYEQLRKSAKLKCGLCNTLPLISGVYIKIIYANGEA